jgi:hypothetical protein
MQWWWGGGREFQVHLCQRGGVQKHFVPNEPEELAGEPFPLQNFSQQKF